MSCRDYHCVPRVSDWGHTFAARFYDEETKV